MTLLVRCAVIAVSIGLQVLDSEAALHLASHFHGGAVLQRRFPVTVWGNSTAPKGTSVTVALDGVDAGKAVVGDDGTWRTQLPPRSDASWDSTLVASDGSSSDTASVRLGEVVLGSGQSNMQMPVYPHDFNLKNGGFSAANGSEEIKAAGRYTGKIMLMSVEVSRPVWNGSYCGYTTPCVPYPVWNNVVPGLNGTLIGFSALTWYTAKDLFERLGGAVPVGAVTGSVGGSPIEAWIPAESVTLCGADNPLCDVKGRVNVSGFYREYIQPLQPYTVGSVLWDQGERDVRCFAPANNKTKEYPCMLKQLVSTWRAGFDSAFKFVTVQLPSYIGDCDSTYASPNATWENCVPGVFNMRLSQEAGTVGDDGSSFAVTYDLSCPSGVVSPECPWGSVHNVWKVPIAVRLAAQFAGMHGLNPPGTVTQGPVPHSATATRSSRVQSSSHISVSVAFVNGDGQPAAVQTRGTQFCATCCGGDVGDFDVSMDGGQTWVNGTMQQVDTSENNSSVTFSVEAPGTTMPTHTRFTANQGFVQCAIVNAAGLPSPPFILPVVSP